MVKSASELGQLNVTLQNNDFPSRLTFEVGLLQSSAKYHDLLMEETEGHTRETLVQMYEQELNDMVRRRDA